MIRIVKMTFQPDRTDDFMGIFNEIKSTIASFDGCDNVELLRDKATPNIFFTYSTWRDEEALDAYRNSDFFKETWTRTKQLFAERADAWSVDEVV